MSATALSAEQMALRGLLLVVVDVQNIVRQANTPGFDVIAHIEQLVESAPTVELVQLARAALETAGTRRAISATAASIHE